MPKKRKADIDKERREANWRRALREHRVVKFDDIHFREFQSPGEASMAALDARRQGFESAHVIRDFEG